MSNGGDTVLVVDDETRLADLFSTWLESEWTIKTAYDGESALEQLDDDVAVVLLDRRMPGLSGDEVLDRIRDSEYETRVVMVTAVDPDFDIIEMGFDDYLVKPVSKEELHDVIDRVIARAQYNADIREYYSLSSKKALLETEKSERALAENDQYQQLSQRVDELRSQVDALREQTLSDHEDFVGAFKQLEEDT